MRILLVEDEPTSAALLAARLVRLGHSPVVARDGEEAWRLISENDFRLVVTDWMMPRLDGPGLCRRIRSVPDRPYIYIILMTSMSDPGQRVQGLEAGADDFVAKCPGPGELAARLRVAERILGMQAELEEKNRRLAELAMTDGLTGIPNRRCLDEGLAAAADRPAKPLSLILLDVDHFKSFNDTHGHAVGDDLLRSVGALLRSTARARDLPARYGGEEFALLLPESDAREARGVAESLRARLEQECRPQGPVTASFGVATTGPIGTPMLVSEADRALYHSKSHGRNRVSHCEDLRPPAGCLEAALYNPAEFARHDCA